MSAAYALGAKRAWQTRKAVLGTIYAFGTADGESVKIGFTTDLQKRRVALSKAVNYFGELDRLLGSALGTFADEQRIHAALRPLSVWATNRRPGYRCNHGPREMYPVSVLNHPACRAIFGRVAA